MAIISYLDPLPIFRWGGFVFLLAPTPLSIARLAIVVIDAVFHLARFSCFPNSTLIARIFLVELLGEVMLSDFRTDLLQVLLAGR